MRRTAEGARAAILDAAEKRLVASGPAGIRLQEVAGDVGVSHPTVLHHFGSREALVQAVIERSFDTINAELVTAIGQSAGGEGQVEAMLEAVFQTLATRGHGRVVVWLALEGQALEGGRVRLADVVSATHALRRRRRAGGRMPPTEDTAYTVVLAAMALLADAVLGPALRKSAGLTGEGASGARFRAWLARLLVAHLER